MPMMSVNFLLMPNACQSVCVGGGAERVSEVVVVVDVVRLLAKLDVVHVVGTWWWWLLF